MSRAFIPDPENEPIRLRVHFNYKKAGWSEVYWMRSSDITSALADATLLCDARATLLAPGPDAATPGPAIVYASCCFAGSARDSFAVRVNRPRYPTGPGWTVPKPPNDYGAAFEYRLEAAGGKWGNRLFRGVSDDYIENIESAGAVWTPLGVAANLLPLAPPPANSQFDLQRSFFDTLLLKTGFLVKGATPNNRATWSVAALTRVVFRQISQRRTGRPFGVSPAAAPNSY